MTEEQNTEPSAYPIGARVRAELAGSFLVCFAIYMICTFGTSIYGLDLAYIVVGTALAYAVVTAMLGRVSGGQFNPAITVAAILTGKTKVVAGILYVIVQVVGAIAAAGAVRWILPTSQTVTMKTWLTPAVNGYGTGSVSSATTSALSLCKLILYSLINQMGKLHCAVTVRLERYRSHITVALITLERHRKILIRQLVLELFAPFQQASTLIAQHIENARILELVGMLQTV